MLSAILVRLVCYSILLHMTPLFVLQMCSVVPNCMKSASTGIPLRSSQSHVAEHTVRLGARALWLSHTIASVLTYLTDDLETESQRANPLISSSLSGRWHLPGAAIA